MITLDMKKLVPDFLLKDRNGYAMTKALEAGMKSMMKVIQDGTDCILNVDRMPEWRLDEMAWETNALYDYTGTVEQKRHWISEAFPAYRYYGTPYALKRYLESLFDRAVVEESDEYDGDAYHFRVTNYGQWSESNENFTKNTVEKVKNLRSVLDRLTYINEINADTIYLGYAMVERQKNQYQMQPFVDVTEEET